MIVRGVMRSLFEHVQVQDDHESDKSLRQYGRTSPKSASGERRSPSAKSAHDSAHYFFRRLSCVPANITRPFSSLMRA